MRRWLGIAGLMAVLLLVAAGGWYLWTLRRQTRATSQRLQETQQSLRDTQTTLAATEDERRELLAAYDELKGRLTTADGELTQLRNASAKMTSELTALASDRTALTKQLDDVTEQTRHLQDAMTAIDVEYATVEAEKVSLQQQLQKAASDALAPEEVQQLTQTVGRVQGEADRLREQMVVLSRAYEQLAQAPSPSAGKPATDDGRLAQRYRRLGDVYLATYQYPRAAQAYERALTLKEAPDMHTRLAFLYSRLLHNPEKAQRHAAAAAAYQDPASTTLNATPGAQGLPRKSWQLLWSWLKQ